MCFFPCCGTLRWVFSTYAEVIYMVLRHLEVHVKFSVPFVVTINVNAILDKKAVNAKTHL